MADGVISAATYTETAQDFLTKLSVQTSLGWNDKISSPVYPDKCKHPVYEHLVKRLGFSLQRSIVSANGIRGTLRSVTCIG